MGWLAALFLLLGSLATPVHLAVEAHDGHHETEDEDHHDSDHKPHPSADHEIVAIRAGVQFVPYAFDAAPIELISPAPDVKICVRTVEAEANSPPDAPGSPPRSARAPPL